jgi:hypothetical protein
MESIGGIDIELCDCEVIGVYPEAHNVSDRDSRAVRRVSNLFNKFSVNSRGRMFVWVAKSAWEVPSPPVSGERKQHLATWVEQDGHPSMCSGAAKVGEEHPTTNRGDFPDVRSFHRAILGMSSSRGPVINNDC